MKKIKMFAGILGIVMIWIVGGCSKQKIVYEDKYIQGQDYQYMHNGGFDVSTIEIDEGYYKLLNSTIYYIEKDTMSVVPLCSKPNCLHDKEEGQKRMECDAYMKTVNGLLGIYGNHLYALCDEYDEDEEAYFYTIYRITMDGGIKDKIYAIKEEGEITIIQWMVHRGYLYYAARQSDENKKDHDTIWRINLEKPSGPEKVYAMTDIYNGNTHYLGAYGNYVYFNNLGFNRDITSDLTDNYVYTTENVWYCYNIVTGEVKEIFQEQKVGKKLVKVVQYLTFWQDKLIIEYFYLDELDGKKKDGEEEDTHRQVWQCDLDGENYEKRIVLEDSYDKLCASENYLYVYNFWRKSIESGKEKPKITVYDKEWNLVDEMEEGAPYASDLLPGNDTCSFCDEVDWDKGVYRIGYMDKSNLGNYKGKEIDVLLLYETKFSDNKTITTEDD